MYITTHDELVKLHGRRCTCIIDGTYIENAKIYVDSTCYERIYICHNYKNLNGDEAPDRLGYSFSWSISKYNDEYEEDNRGCTEILVNFDKFLIGELK